VFVLGKKNTLEYYYNEQYEKLEKGFVKYADLCRVVRLDPNLSSEGFSIIPVIGSGVIGRYSEGYSDSREEMEQSSPNVIVRETVYKMLCKADEALKHYNKNWQILVLGGYRNLEIQQELFDKEYEKLKPRFVDCDKLDLLEAVHRLVAVPEVAGHPTGGAADVTIYDFQTNEELDFGTAPIDFSTRKRYYASKEISEQAKKNRALLRKVMCEQGFVPYDGEWWHFSYGDKEWAYYSYRRQSREAAKNSGESLSQIDIMYHYAQLKSTEITYVDKYRMSDSEPVVIDNKKLRFAVQKSGRLTEQTIKLLERSGIEVVAESGKFFGKCRNFPLELLFVRDDDIPSLVESGVADIGAVGENVLFEQMLQDKVQTVLSLGFGRCSLALAVPKDANIKTVKDLKGKTIATSYRNSTLDFLSKMGVNDVKIVDITGSVEISPAIGYADAIVDLVSTGNSLRQNNLSHLQTIYESQSILIANPQSLGGDKKAIIDKLLQRFESSLGARGYKSLSFVCPQSKIKDVREISNLTNVIEAKNGLTGTSAMQFVVDKNILWTVIEKLKELDISDIFVFDVEGYIK
jgi:ATP phosphoribosyltransferase